MPLLATHQVAVVNRRALLAVNPWPAVRGKQCRLCPRRELPRCEQWHTRPARSAVRRLPCIACQQRHHNQRREAQRDRDDARLAERHERVFGGRP